MKPTTNVELVTQMLEHSHYGALAQAFIIEAIAQYAAATATLTDEQVAEMDQGSAVSIKAWRGIAREIQQQLDEFYQR